MLLGITYLVQNSAFEYCMHSNLLMNKSSNSELCYGIKVPATESLTGNSANAGLVQ